jgi:hypothetical protein
MITFTTKDQLRKAIENYFNGLDNSDISNWDTSQITDMSELFQLIKQKTVEPITLNWNTRNVKNMYCMFFNCKQDFILNFDTGNVENMCAMFSYSHFNQPLLFNTSNVNNMQGMFYNATNFNQPLLFNTSNVISMSGMFYNATNFNQPLNFDTRNVETMYSMFCNATSFNQPIYFQSCNKDFYENIFKNSPMNGQESKYVLEPQYYNKLLLFYLLNEITPELPYLCDEFEEFY